MPNKFCSLCFQVLKPADGSCIQCTSCGATYHKNHYDQACIKCDSTIIETFQPVYPVFSDSQNRVPEKLLTQRKQEPEFDRRIVAGIIFLVLFCFIGGTLWVFREEEVVQITVTATNLLPDLQAQVLLSTVTSKQPISPITSTEVPAVSLTAPVTPTLEPSASPIPASTIESRPSPLPQIENNWQQGKLAFLQTNTLYILDLVEGGRIRELANISSDAVVLGPIWSPDGRTIVLYDTVGQLYFVSTTNGNVRFGTSNCTSPSWSSNGEQILCRSANPQVFKVINAVSGNNIREVSRPDHSFIPNWSPSGQEIVFSVFDDPEARRTSIWRISLDGGNPARLTSTGGQDYAPVWSPDGQYIAYQSIDGSVDSEIWIMDRNGENARRLTDTPDGKWSRAPFWSPDGKWLAFVSNQSASNGSETGEIFVVSVSTGEIHQVTNTGGNVYNWRVSWTN